LEDRFSGLEDAPPRLGGGWGWGAPGHSACDSDDRVPPRHHLWAGWTHLSYLLKLPGMPPRKRRVMQSVVFCRLLSSGVFLTTSRLALFQRCFCSFVVWPENSETTLPDTSPRTRLACQWKYSLVCLDPLPLRTPPLPCFQKHAQDCLQGWRAYWRGCRLVSMVRTPLLLRIAW
jgi:hypothetical protein